MSVYPKNRINEMVGFLLIARTFCLFLSLISYHPLDPSLNVSSPEKAYENFIGQAGAWLADFLFQIFGLAALLLPIPLLFLGYKMIRHRKIRLRRLGPLRAIAGNRSIGVIQSRNGVDRSIALQNGDAATARTP